MKYAKNPLIIVKLCVIVVNILLGIINLYEYYFGNSLFFSIEKNEIGNALNYFIISVLLILFTLITEEFKKRIIANLVGVILLIAISLVKANPYDFYQILDNFIVYNQSQSLISIIHFILNIFISLSLIGLLIYQITITLLSLCRKFTPNLVEDNLFKNKLNRFVLFVVVFVGLINVVLGIFDIHYHYTKDIMFDSPHTSGSRSANAHFLISLLLTIFIILKTNGKGLIMNLICLILLALTIRITQNFFIPSEFFGEETQSFLSSIYLTAMELFRFIIEAIGVLIIYFLLIYQIIFTGGLILKNFKFTKSKKLDSD